jgi:heme-degrading monooxygenase HmoA
VSEARLLRLFRFRPVGSGSAFDAAFREPFRRFCASPGIVRAYAGRHGAGDAGERVVVSIWDTDEAGAGPFEIEALEGVEDRQVEALSVRVAAPLATGDDSTAILRVFRGATRPGQLDAYADDVRDGVAADLAAGHGPLALFLGVGGPDSFVTVSAWRDWDAIQAATGADVRRPVSTRHTSRLLSGSVQHYEVLPEASAAPEPVAIGD